GEVGFYGGATGYGTPYQEPGYQVDYSEPLSRPVKGRVVRMGIGGRITTIAQVEQILAGDRLDMGGAVRGHIAEPNIGKNAMEGREDRSRTWLSVSYCTGADRGGRVGWGCVINPETGHERRWGKDSWTRTGDPRKVVVVGAGPSGMEAARVAAKLGHRV